MYEKTYEMALKKWDSLAKPLGSLGILEENICRMAALTGSVDVHIDHPRLIVCCADNGVVSEGISQSDESVTKAVYDALIAGTSTVCNLAKDITDDIVAIDAGMVPNGTKNIRIGAAMSSSQCRDKIALGKELVKKAVSGGADIILTGEMGIGNTTTASAIASVLLGMDPAEVAGRGAGLSDEALAKKIEVIRDAIKINAPDDSDSMDVLSKLGGFDIACMTGIFLGGYEAKVPVVIDGLISSVAALLAFGIEPDSAKAMIASHVSSEPAARMILDRLGLSPIICADMHLGEGSGAVLAIPLLRGALNVYNSGHTFENLGIEAYTPQH